MKIDWSFLFFLIVIILAGCASGLQVSATSVPNFTPSASQLGSYTPTVSSLKTPIILPGIKLETQCLDILPALPAYLTSAGILVLEDEFSINVFLKNMTTGAIEELSPSTNLHPIDIFTSPNRRWLAYEAYRWEDNKYYKDGLVIVKNDGSLYKTLDNVTYILLGWLDDENLVLRALVYIPTSDAYPIPSEDMTVVPPLLILNPFTGERQILEPDIPDLFPWGGKIPWWYGWSGLVYDPTLRYAAYLGEEGLTLRDLENERTIASALFDVYSRPYWSPDGERFAVTDSLDHRISLYEIFTMDLNGEVLQLSNLSAYHISNYVSGLTWSPDGRYLAFWLSSWDEEVEYTFYNTMINPPASLAVLDTVSGKMINYCIQGDSLEFDTPLWSPDGSQIVILEDQDTDSVDYDRVILIDLELGLAAQIVENMIPVGWLREP